LAALEKLLKRNPIVKRVKHLEIRYPNQVVVDLDYAEPVAIARFKNGQKVVIDSDAVLLPGDAISPETEKALVELAVHPNGFVEPVDPRYGEPWCHIGSGPTSAVPRPDERVAQAAKLAAFLKQRIQEHDRSASAIPRLPALKIHDSLDHKQLYVQYGDRVMIRWTGYDENGPTDQAKWAMVSDWLGSNALTESELPIYIHFGANGIEARPGEIRSQPAPGPGG
jgi:hypothetical protein